MTIHKGAAVITGAGSGIGRALAMACIAKGMPVLAVDVDMDGLHETQTLVDGDLRIWQTDVSDAQAVENMAAHAYKCFETVSLLANNAGVALGGPCWEASAQDWSWAIGVNLMGVANGIRSFVPRMNEQNAGAHIMNTASAAGLISVPGAGVYCATKHAVVTLSECLFQELKLKKYDIGVSVLCPSFVKTGIADSARNRPENLQNSGPALKRDEMMAKALEHADISAEEIADRALICIENDQFYILPHAAITQSIEQRIAGITGLQTPATTVLPGLEL